MKYYVEVFQVTETCANGKERRIKKEVLCPIFRNGKHVIILDRVTKAIKLLEEHHYYNIEHVETKTKDVLMID